MVDAPLQTPVLFLIFNRPDTTRRVFDAICKAQPARLFVAADGPRPNRPGETDLCTQTRAIVKQIDWECEVHTLFRDTNLGCGEAVSSGITWFFSHVNEGIILEDDCLPDPSFFRFCEELLHYYRNDTRVMMITGTNYISPGFVPEESYYFSRYYPIWGWATWKRAWKLYDRQMADWPKYKKGGHLNAVYRETRLVKHLEFAFDSVYDRIIDTWDFQWVYTCIFQSGLCIVPRYNLISNIGVADGTHTQTGSGRQFTGMYTRSIEVDNLVHPPHVTPNIILDKMCIDTILPRSGSERIVRQLKNAWSKISSLK